MEINNDKNENNQDEIDPKTIRHLLKSSLETLTYDDKKEYNPKFLYKILGFYNSYKKLSDDINNNIIIVNYLNCENNLIK